jgi:hypothetical protein
MPLWIHKILAFLKQRIGLKSVPIYMVAAQLMGRPFGHRHRATFGCNPSYFIGERGHIMSTRLRKQTLVQGSTQSADSLLTDLLGNDHGERIRDNSELPIEQSVQFMLAEFNRIQEGELLNRSGGDTRVNLFVTIFSISCAGLVTLRQITNVTNPQELLHFRAIALAAFLFLFVVGFSVLRMLIGRWVLTIIYLRKLARIRRWFAKYDRSLMDYLVYSIDETKPSFLSRNFLSSSIITLVITMNSLSLASSFVFTLLILDSPNNFSMMLILGLVTGLSVILLQRVFIARILSRHQSDDFCTFPADSAQ